MRLNPLMMHPRPQVMFPDRLRESCTHGKRTSQSTPSWLQSRSHRFLVLFVVLVMLGRASVSQAAIIATWNPNPESDIAGYIISYGTLPGVHPASVDVGNVTTWQLTGLAPGQTYYFVLQAYNTAAMRSAPSAEVVFTVPVASPPALTQPANQTSVENGAVSLLLVASNPNGTVLTYSATGLPPGLSVNAATGLISGTLPFASAGTYNVTATVSDGSLTDSKTFTWTVTPASSLPAPWTAQDVGSPAQAGNATYSPGAFSVTAAGADIWGINDQFQFVYQPLAGDGEIVALVNSLQNTDPWAKAGVMIRADLTGGAPNAMALATPGNGMVFQQRVNPGDASASTNPTAVFPGVAPYWIRLVRSGNTFAGYYSATGTTWILMGSTVVPMASAAYVGLAVTSHNPSLVTSATFSNVTVTAGSSQPPTLTQPANQTSAENATVSLQLLGRDTDGDTLTYRAAGLPPALSVNAATGLISGTLTSTSAGTYSVIATVSDGLLSNSKTFTWTVTNGNRPPAHTRSDFDFDGDGRADLTVFRPSNGTWYVLQSKTNYASATGMQWGNGLDMPVPGDYDGDGKTDIAVFRPSNGTWYVFYSSTGSIVGVQWGNGRDVPVPGDYDGDGKTDIAVFRPSNGIWYVLSSSTGTMAGVQWGNGLDVPVPGDYDGDGKTDIAVFRPSNGTWYVVYSSTGTMAGVQWGNGLDVPVPGDYDGDGKTDIAVFRLSDGTWYIRYSSTGAIAGIQLGNGSDVPVPGDFDGDGKIDIAVFRPSNGMWYLRYSSTGTTAGFQWGNGNDIPVPKRQSRSAGP